MSSRSESAEKLQTASTSLNFIHHSITPRSFLHTRLNNGPIEAESIWTRHRCQSSGRSWFFSLRKIHFSYTEEMRFSFYFQQRSLFLSSRRWSRSHSWQTKVWWKCLRENRTQSYGYRWINSWDWQSRTEECKAVGKELEETPCESDDDWDDGEHRRCRVILVELDLGTDEYRSTR